MEEKEQLKPCPFCGHKAPEVLAYPYLRYDPKYRVGVICKGKDCFVEGPLRLTEEEAIAAWNHRVVV